MRQNNKIIHYFLEGDLGYDFRDSWKKHCPDYEIVKWDLSNIEIPEWLQKFIDQKRWSIISDYVRRWAIYKYGGVYLDFDVELIASLDPVLDFEAFICIEGEPIAANAAVTGGVAGNRFHMKLLGDYKKVITGEVVLPGQLETAAGPGIATKYVEWHKMSKLDQRDLNTIRYYENFVTLPKEYFYPFNWNEEFGGITDKTIGIHHWKKGWG